MLLSFRYRRRMAFAVCSESPPRGKASPGDRLRGPARLRRPASYHTRLCGRGRKLARLGKGHKSSSASAFEKSRLCCPAHAEDQVGKPADHRYKHTDAEPYQAFLLRREHAAPSVPYPEQIRNSGNAQKKKRQYVHAVSISLRHAHRVRGARGCLSTHRAIRAAPAQMAISATLKAGQCHPA